MQLGEGGCNFSYFHIKSAVFLGYREFVFWFERCDPLENHVLRIHSVARTHLPWGTLGWREHWWGQQQSCMWTREEEEKISPDHHCFSRSA